MCVCVGETSSDRTRDSSDNVRAVYNEKEGAGGKGLISLAAPLSAHFGATEGPR